jgi:hypothetical protein
MLNWQIERGVIEAVVHFIILEERQIGRKRYEKVK